MWIKAQPNLGKTVSYETYELDKVLAEQNPSVRNDILAKRFGIPLEGMAYLSDDIQVHRKRSFWQMSCSMGIDLSQGDDFCAAVEYAIGKDGQQLKKVTIRKSRS